MNDVLSGRTSGISETKIKNANDLIDRSLSHIILHWPDAQQFIEVSPTSVYMFLKAKNIWPKIKKTFGNQRSVLIRKFMQIARKIVCLLHVLNGIEVVLKC